MLTLHRRRRVAGTVYYDAAPHARHYRACNADRFDAARDQFAVARAIVNALAFGGAVFGVAVALWVAAVVIMGW